MPICSNHLVNTPKRQRRSARGVKNDVTYKTNGWTNHRKADLTEQLLDLALPHSWARDYLTVAGRFNPTTDRLVLHRAPDTAEPPLIRYHPACWVRLVEHGPMTAVSEPR